MDDKTHAELSRMEFELLILEQRIALYNYLVHRALMGGGQ